MGYDAELDIINALALRCWKEITEKEDQRVVDRIEDLYGGTEHKAFDKKAYAKEARLDQLTKEELKEALIAEANIRYNTRCELEDERIAFRRLKNELNQVRGEVIKWKHVADSLRQTVQHLMGY